VTINPCFFLVIIELFSQRVGRGLGYDCADDEHVVLLLFRVS